MLSTFLTSWFSGALSNGEREAREAQYQEVMRTLGPSLLRVGAVYGFKGADREEIEQDIAIAIWEALPGWNTSSSLRTYLFRVAHNTSIDRLRRAGRQVHLADGDEVENQSAPGSSPESKAMERQTLRHLQRTIETLPLLQRQVVTLAMEDVSTEEISQILGITNNYVHVLVHRARQTLRSAMEVDHER